MSVGVLLVTHEDLGRALIAAARHVMPQPPLPVAALNIPADADTDSMRRLTARQVRELDRGDGVIVLSDLYGATPCNISLSLRKLGANMRCVSGLNLPMLLRIFNYADKPLYELAEIAASGGRAGILIDHA